MRELIQAKERPPPTPTPPSGSHKASSPDSALFQPESTPLPSLRGAASKTTKTRWLSPGPRKTHENPLPMADVSLPLAEPPLSPERHPHFYTHPSRGNCQDSLSGSSAPFFFLFRTILQCHSPHRGWGAKEDTRKRKKINNRSSRGVVNVT